VPDGALERAVELLARLGETPSELTVPELATDTGMPTSTAYRLLAELERHGLVQRSSGRTVSLGTRVVALGRAAEARLRERIVEPATGVMQELARELGETVILTAPCGCEAIVLHVVEAEEHAVRLSYASYRRAPMHRGASGKILAAYLDPSERERLIAAAGDPGLGAALTHIRAEGFVVTTDELDHGASAAAAPILDSRGRIAAGLSVAGPTERILPRLDRAIAAVRAATRRIEAVSDLIR
jgi:DNA-binding IclR family transcriptional regulator